MSSNEDFLKFIMDQIKNAGTIHYEKMFGEYAIYSDKKIVALICDNKLFVKQTEGGRSFIGDVVEAPPYPSAKLCFRIEDKYKDKEWISSLISITAKELPTPKPRKNKIRRK
jgi:TfoX/Sxy family transcriptional regulator of competence genes